MTQDWGPPLNERPHNILGHFAVLTAIGLIVLPARLQAAPSENTIGVTLQSLAAVDRLYAACAKVKGLGGHDPFFRCVLTRKAINQQWCSELYSTRSSVITFMVVAYPNLSRAQLYEAARCPADGNVGSASVDPDSLTLAAAKFIIWREAHIGVAEQTFHSEGFQQRTLDTLSKRCAVGDQADVLNLNKGEAIVCSVISRRWIEPRMNNAWPEIFSLSPDNK